MQRTSGEPSLPDLPLRNASDSPKKSARIWPRNMPEGTLLNIVRSVVHPAHSYTREVMASDASVR